MNNRTYKKTYFRVECGYVWGKGIDEGPLLAFNTEVKELLSELGFVVLHESGQRMRGSCLEMARGKEMLYCHPMGLSGPILVDWIDQIKVQLAKARGFRLRMVDSYETGIDYTEDELRQVLALNTSELQYMIYQGFGTSRVIRFFNEIAAQDILSHTCDRFAREVVKILDKHEHTHLIGATVKVLMEAMTNQGYIVRLEREGRIFYRSRNKGELHQIRLPVPMSSLAESENTLQRHVCGQMRNRGHA